jgi:hypothetical protein
VTLSNEPIRAHGAPACVLSNAFDLMPSNRRRHINTLPLLSLARWTVVAGFFCFAGLGYVYCKNQLHRAGEETRKLEKDLNDLKMATEVARSKIATLSSHEELKRKLDSNFIKLVPITDDRIVRVTDAAPVRRVSDDELRSVRSERTNP